MVEFERVAREAVCEYCTTVNVERGRNVTASDGTTTTYWYGFQCTHCGHGPSFRIQRSGS